MAFEDASYVADVLAGVGAVLGDAFTDAGRAVDVRRFPGVPSWDCEMLALWPQLGAVNKKARGSVAAEDWLGTQFRHTLTINVLLLRCVTAATDTGMPAPSVVDADGAAFATDQWILERTITQSVRDGTLVPDTCSVGRVTPVVPQAPQGGLSGMTTTIEVGLG